MQQVPVHTSATSIWPLLAGVAIGSLVIGIISTPILSAIGVVLLFFSLGGWTLQNHSEAGIHAAQIEQANPEEEQHE